MAKPKPDASESAIRSSVLTVSVECVTLMFHQATVNVEDCENGDFTGILW